MSDNNTSERKPLILIAEDVESNYKLLEIILKKSTICCGPKTARKPWSTLSQSIPTPC